VSRQNTTTAHRTKGAGTRSRKPRPAATKARKAPAPRPRRPLAEIGGLLAGAGTVLLGMALGSHGGLEGGGGNWVGPVGAALAGTLMEAFGWAAWLVLLEAAVGTVRLFTRRPSPLGWALPPVLLSALLLSSAFIHLLMTPDGVPASGVLPGGVLGELLGEVGRAVLGFAGAIVVSGTLVLVALLLRTRLTLRGLAQVIVGAGAWIADRVVRGLHALAEAWREAEAIDRAERAAQAPRVVGAGAAETVRSEGADEPGSGPRPTSGGTASDSSAGASGTPVDGPPGTPSPDAAGTAADVAPVPRTGSGGGSVAGAGSVVGAGAGSVAGGRAPAVASRGGDPPLPRIVPPKTGGSDSPEAAASPSSAGGVKAPRLGDGYRPPPTSLLDPAPPSGIAVDAARLRAQADRLVDKLEAYGVKGRVDEIHPGPVVTMYEFEPRSGTKIAKIAGLADDLAMALAAQKVRIVAPIPGKARVGFELPNEQRQTVYLRQVLEDERWRRTRATLPVAFGKDIAGQPVFGDLAKMPHLLVAGATGSGKSVGINVMLCSLLQQKTPEEVRLLMIDPKVVELAVFDGIPHMLLPVVTDMRKAALSLRWAVDEMERRYQLFADAGARNIASYNDRVQRVLDGDLDPKALRRRTRKAPGDDPEQLDLDQAGPPEKLPYVVVVVDEFADLMMVAAKDVEACIARLAQKARAAGIHVLLATQRPSVDVITGMIKANFPARIAYKVSQREDSKTILGRSGAEHLLGMGDMLMLPPGSGDLKRVHSAYVSEDEVRAVCDHLRAQGEPVYDEDILRPRDDDDGGAGPGGNADDPLYDRAVAAVAQAGYCSISHLQRQLGIGYNKAAKLVEQMEQEGVVGPASGKAGGRREVFVQPV